MTRRLYGSATYRFDPSQASDVGVFMESAASVASSMLPPTWPRTMSAAAAFAVGIFSNSRTRSLPPSATNNRVPSDSAKRGKFKVELQ